MYLQTQQRYSNHGLVFCQALWYTIYRNDIEYMNFTIYSKENCPYCYKVKQVLELTGSDFITYNLDEDFTKEEFYEKFGKGSTFPQVICDETILGGSVDTIKFLKQKQVIKS